MKKLIFALGLILAFFTRVSSADDNLLSLGVQGGLSFDTATTPSQISSSTKTGFQVGVNLQAKLTDSVYLQPELMYMHRTNNFANANSLVVNVNYDSLIVPAFIKLKFLDHVRPFVLAGPAAIFNISSSVSGSFGGVSGAVSLNPRSVEYAFIGGAGVELEMFYAELRYMMGFVDMDQNSTSFQSRGFQLLVGVQL